MCDFLCFSFLLFVSFNFTKTKWKSISKTRPTTTKKNDPKPWNSPLLVAVFGGSSWYWLEELVEGEQQSKWDNPNLLKISWSLGLERLTQSKLFLSIKIEWPIWEEGKKVWILVEENPKVNSFNMWRRNLRSMDWSFHVPITDLYIGPWCSQASTSWYGNPTAHWVGGAEPNLTRVLWWASKSVLGRVISADSNATLESSTSHSSVDWMWDKVAVIQI